MDYQINTGLFGIPVATFGLVTIAAAVFVHATFSDELSAMGTRVYEAAEQGMNKATELAETAQVAISEQANRMGEAVSSAKTATETAVSSETAVTVETAKTAAAETESTKKEGGRKRRKTTRKRT